MNPGASISLLVELPAAIEQLLAEASNEGFGFVDKLVAEWRSGANTFDKPGEALFGAFTGSQLVAVGGLNRDPYVVGDGFGRLRHLYVANSARRPGLGSALVSRVLEHASGVFHAVRLRTDTPGASDLYGSLGFLGLQDQAATHIKHLPAANIR
jgi:GNAT superfamily N-acetyltransferase